jgi:hypothetical protein
MKPNILIAHQTFTNIYKPHVLHLRVRENISRTINVSENEWVFFTFYTWETNDINGPFEKDYFKCSNCNLQWIVKFNFLCICSSSLLRDGTVLRTIILFFFSCKARKVGKVGKVGKVEKVGIDFSELLVKVI